MDNIKREHSMFIIIKEVDCYILMTQQHTAAASAAAAAAAAAAVPPPGHHGDWPNWIHCDWPCYVNWYKNYVQVRSTMCEKLTRRCECSKGSR
jgi:hypothetical protein